MSPEWAAPDKCDIESQRIKEKIIDAASRLFEKKGL